MEYLIVALVSILVGGAGYYAYTNVYKKPSQTKKTVEPQNPSGEEEAGARTKAKEILLEAKDEAFRVKKEAEEESAQVRKRSFELEQRLVSKEESIEKKLTAFEDKEQHLRTQQEEMQKKLADVEKVKQEQLEKLERVAGLTKDEAKAFLLEATELRLKDEVARRIREAEAEAKETSDKKARELIVDAMFHGATDYVAEYTVSVVKLPDEEMKGRIIGKEGRNIKTFEQLTGVDFDVDETPGEIRLSCFDPVRREIARVALEKLMKDGRIHPARIEEVVRRTQDEIERIVHQEGEKLCHKLGIYNLPPEIIDYLGKFKYRFSYGQNLIAHTLEETKIGVKLAYELGADPQIVKLGCLLHDIGKVVADEEGTHVELGVELLKKFKLPEEVVDSVAEHHEDKPFSRVESVIVYIADAISGSRPGARYEAYDEYIKRVTSIEDISKSFPGVSDAFAVSAGREVRVIVFPDKIDDAATTKLAHDIAEKIHNDVTYPGSVKVTVLRETRATDVAK